MTERLVVGASEGKCVTRATWAAPEDVWPGILVSISHQSNLNVNQYLCINTEDFNGTKDPTVKLIGDDSYIFDVLAAEYGN